MVSFAKFFRLYDPVFILGGPVSVTNKEKGGVFHFIASNKQGPRPSLAACLKKAHRQYR